MESYLGAKVEALTPKTKLQSYWDSDFNAFLAVLKKNQKKLGINPSGRDASEMLKDELPSRWASLSRCERGSRGRTG